MVKGQPLGRKGRHLGAAQGAGRVERVGVGQGRIGLQVAAQQGVLHAGQSGLQGLHHRQAIVVFARVGHPVTGQQDFGLDLSEAVQHSSGAHVGGANAPNRTQARGGQEGDHGLGDVGQVSRDPVSSLNAQGAQAQRQRGGLALQFGPREFTGLALFIGADEGGKAGRMRGPGVPKNLLRVIHLCACKPDGARHGIAAQGLAVGRGGLQIKIIPAALPKSIQLRGRPMPQRLVAVKAQPPLAGQPVLVKADLGLKRGRGQVSVHGRWAFRAEGLTWTGGRAGLNAAGLGATTPARRFVGAGATTAGRHERGPSQKARRAPPVVRQCRWIG